MANRSTASDDAKAINSGEEATNTPVGIGLDDEGQFRNIVKRLDDLTNQVSGIAKPKEVRWADGINFALLVFAALAALITGWGLKDRIDDLVKGQSESERRVTAQVSASEGRIDTKLDRLDDRFTRLDERTATLEGARGSHPAGN